MGAPFLLTVDVEPDWGIRGTACVREVLPRFCGLLDRHGVRATFFVVGDLVESCRDTIARATVRHEIASHGLTHRRLDGLDDAAVRCELAESRRALESAFGVVVRGFRAPFLRPPGGWHRRLAEAGYAYDSSEGCVAPSRRNRSPRHWTPFRRDGVVEIPATTLRTGWIPFSLTYLRLLAPFGERLISERAAMMYLHLHELADPRLARVLGAPWRWALPRKAGAPAWEIMERIVERAAPRAMTCAEFVKRSEGGIAQVP